MALYTVVAELIFDVEADSEEEAKSVVWVATENPMHLDGCHYIDGKVKVVDTAANDITETK